MKKFRICSLLMVAVMMLAMVVPSAMAEEPEGLLDALTGTYDELFTVICAPEFDAVWLDRCTEYAGEENAAMAVEMLQSACVGTIYGQEAVDAYADAPEAAQFDCYFIEGVAQLIIDGNHISGIDAEGNEVFAHDYEYVETLEDVIACHVYKTEDADAGKFTYFCFASDTPDSTYHIEFRYGDDLEALAQYYDGEYAYWLAAGILADRDEDMLYNVIDLFCSENLAEME